MSRTGTCRREHSGVTAWGNSLSELAVDIKWQLEAMRLKARAVCGTRAACLVPVARTQRHCDTNTARGALCYQTAHLFRTTNAGTSIKWGLIFTSAEWQEWLQFVISTPDHLASSARCIYIHAWILSDSLQQNIRLVQRERQTLPRQNRARSDWT
jgi:hypothetical protein